MSKLQLALSEAASIVSVQFMLMMIIIAIILIFHDSRKLKKWGCHKDYKIARFIGISYLILGVSLYIVGRFIV